MTVEFFEKNKISEVDKISNILPFNLMDEELTEKVGTNVILKWTFKTFTPKIDRTNVQEREQLIYLFSINGFSKKLDVVFFENLIQDFDLIFDYDWNQSYQLFFQLIPMSPPIYQSRISWWDSKIVCFEFKQENWNIISDDLWELGELFNDDILKLGLVKIENVI